MIEITKKCTAKFANKEYCVKLDNKFDISTNYMISLNIVLKKQLGDYEIDGNNFTDNISLYLTIIYNNGLIGKYIVENAIVNLKCATIDIKGDFIINDNLQCIEELRYQIVHKKNNIKLIKKQCFKLIKDCVTQPYYGDAYFSLLYYIDPNRHSFKIWDRTNLNLPIFEGIIVTTGVISLPGGINGLKIAGMYSLNDMNFNLINFNSYILFVGAFNGINCRELYINSINFNIYADLNNNTHIIQYNPSGATSNIRFALGNFIFQFNQ